MTVESTVGFPETGSGGRRPGPAEAARQRRAGTVRRERLAGRRKSLGLTQEDLAALLRVDRSTVVRWERGETQPLPWMRPRLAKALLVSPDRLAELLRADSLASGTSDQGPARGAFTRAVPRQLPAAVPDFTGRTAELAALTELLDAVGTGPGAVVISVIGGTAGVGKTALALHWAHRIADRFPDGQLHVNLRGFDPGSTPATAEEAICGFLGALGVPPERIPAGLDAQVGLYRSLVSGRRMLIVLDNARDEEQLRPLLPSSHASMVIVTSRRQLAGLAAANGARLLNLDVLSHADAVRLLTSRLGARRAGDEPEAVAEIAARCACLPLAIAVAAARAAARPGFPLAALSAELRDAVGSVRLDAFDSDDQAASVTAVFSWSYQQLSEGGARLFRLLGLHPGPDFSAPAATSLAAVGEPEARQRLRELARAHLLTEHAPGRYSCHELLRAYAASQASAHDSQAERSAAVTRLLDHYLHTASAASLVLRPRRAGIALAPPAPGVVPEPCDSHQQAMSWFDREHRVLLAAAALAAGGGSDRHAWQLSWAVMPFLTMRGHLREAVATQGAALAAATRLGSTAGRAVCGEMLGEASHLAGDDEAALRHFTDSRALYQQLGDRRGEAAVVRWLAAVAERQGHVAVALSRYEEALRLRPPVPGDKAEEAEVLNSVGRCHALLGDYQQARTCCQRSLALAAELEPRSLQYHVQDTLGYVEGRAGGFGAAVAHFERALRLCREYGDLMSEARILTHLGDTCAAVGGLPAARDAWQQACDILESLGHPDAAEIRSKLRRYPG